MSQKHLRWVVGNDALKARQLLDVFVVEPLDFEVQVHVVGALTQPLLLVLCTYKKTQEPGMRLSQRVASWERTRIFVP